MATNEMELQDAPAIRDRGIMITISRAKARDLVDQVDDDRLMYALDEAQGDAYDIPQYVVIKILPKDES